VKSFLISAILVLSFALSARAADPKLTTKFYPDSAKFTMSFDQSKPLKAGSVFEVKIHVKPGKGWHIWSADMSSEGGLTPLNLAMPSEISKYFELVSFRETGEVTTGYDSSFDVATRAHLTEYDVIAKINVLQSSPTPVPFYLYLNYQTCNETTCQPPRWYEVPMTVLGEKPVNLSLAMRDEENVAHALACVSRGISP
jgi:hypothetical protein